MGSVPRSKCRKCVSGGIGSQTAGEGGQLVSRKDWNRRSAILNQHQFLAEDVERITGYTIATVLILVFEFHTKTASKRLNRA